MRACLCVCVCVRESACVRECDVVVADGCIFLIMLVDVCQCCCLILFYVTVLQDTFPVA